MPEPEGHSIIIINDEINRLIVEAGENTELVQRLNNLKTKANAVNARLEQRQPPIPPLDKAAMHEILESLQAWLEGAHVTDGNFETMLDDYIVSLDEYDG